MTETWLPFAIRRPGPPQKIGYGSLRATPLSEKEGEVKHSAEGSLGGAFAVLDNLDIQSSWTGILAKDGRIFQHYPLEAITWQAGKAGDRRQDTSLIGNLTLNGWEHEGGGPNAPGEPLTEPQYQSTLRVSEFTRSVMPLVAAAPPTLRRNLWEHNWITATACPSGRIPWARLIADLIKEEDDMATPEETRTIMREEIERYEATRRSGRRGLQRMLTSGRVTSGMVRGDEDTGGWPDAGDMVTFRMILDRIAAIEPGSGGALSDADVDRIANAVIAKIAAIWTS